MEYPFSPYENYNSGIDDAQAIYDVNWKAQTFTAFNTTHIVSYVALKLKRTGNPGTITVSIRGFNTGSFGGDLCSGTTNGNTLTTDADGEWRTIAITPTITLTHDTKYSIIVRATSGDISNSTSWKCDSSSPEYTRGDVYASTNSGSSWTIDTAKDFIFKIEGHPYEIEINSASVDHPTVNPSDTLTFTGISYYEETTSPVSGKAMVFDNGDDYVACANSASLNFTDFTVAFWIRHAANDASDRIIDKQASGPAGAWVFLYLSANVIQFTGRSGVTASFALASPTLTAGKWYFIMGTYDSATTTARLYCNTTLQGSDTSAGWTETASVVTIGRRSGTAANYMASILDNVWMFNRVLNSTEQSYLYQRKTPMSTTGLALSMDFDEPSGTLAYDKSVSANSGTVYGTPTRTDVFPFPFNVELASVNKLRLAEYNSTSGAFSYTNMITTSVTAPTSVASNPYNVYAINVELSTTNQTVTVETVGYEIQASIINMDNVDNVYANYQFYNFSTSSYNYGGYADFTTIVLNITQGSTVRASFQYSEDTNTFSKLSGGGAWSLNTTLSLAIRSGNWCNTTFRIKPNWNATQEDNVELKLICTDSLAQTTTQTMQTDYADIINTVINSQLTVSNWRVNWGASETLNLRLRYIWDIAEPTRSYTGIFIPASVMKNITLHDSLHNVISYNTTFGNNVVPTTMFTFNVPLTTGANTYHVYVDMVDASYTDKDITTNTALVVSDGIRVTGLVSSSTIPNVGESTTISAVAELAYNAHPLGAGDFIVIGGYNFTWAPSNVFQCVIPSQITNTTINFTTFTSGYEADTGVTTGTMNGHSLSLTWTTPSGGSGHGMPISFFVSNTALTTNQGKTIVLGSLNFNWTNSNTITITGVKIVNAPLGWAVEVAVSLPAVFSKTISGVYALDQSGVGALSIRVLILSDTPVGTYSINAEVEASSGPSGNAVANGYVNISVAPPLPLTGTESGLSGVMSVVFIGGLMALMGVAFFGKKRYR